MTDSGNGAGSAINRRAKMRNGTGRKLKTLSLKRKIELIEEWELSGKRQKVIAEEFEIPPNTVSTILKQKEHYKEQFYRGFNNINRRRFRPSHHEDVEERLLKWFIEERDSNVSLSGLFLVEKANRIAEELGKTGWKCSEGWVSRFKKRHNLTLKNISGESNTLDPAAVEQWRERNIKAALKHFGSFAGFSATDAVADPPTSTNPASSPRSDPREFFPNSSPNPAGFVTDSLDTIQVKQENHSCHSSPVRDQERNMNSLTGIVSKLKQFAPLSLAASWDNVGLLVEPSPPKYVSKIMLTNDLTMPVMEEAKTKTVDLILSYHPPIFTPIKQLTQCSWKERLIVECMENRIAVFSPHTSYDAIQGGVNDWLISAFDVKKDTIAPIQVSESFQNGDTHVLEIDLEPARLKQIRDEALTTYLPPDSRFRKKDAFSLQTLKSNSGSSSELWRLETKCKQNELTDLVKGLVCSGCKEKYSVSPLGEIGQRALNEKYCKETWYTRAMKTCFEMNKLKVPMPKTGAGRRATLNTPVSLDTAIGLVKKHLGLQLVSVAKGHEEIEINTVAVCAGSGSSVLRGVSSDLLVTGEMSHHEVLDAVHNGSNVILCHHSNTERGYLVHLRAALSEVLGNGVEIFVSEVDRDPLEIV